MPQCVAYYSHGDLLKELFIAGERELRAQTSALLRRYVRFVMPVIFPSSMFRAGRAAFDAPFEAIVAPLMHTESQ